MFNIRRHSKSFFSYSVLLIVSLLLPSIVLAQSAGDSSSVALTVGADVAPPTVPGNLTTNVISSSQINLAWDASTDAFGVAGYHVFRDNVLIATTTHPTITYSDTGLSASTLYAYQVTAFDNVPFESAKSATSSDTTLAGGGGGGGGTPLPVTSNVTVVVSTSTALITWDTDRLTIGSVSWGETSGLELGSASESVYSLTHEVLLETLNPDTLHYYQVEVVDQYSQTVREPIANFTTDPLPDTTPPDSVSGFTSVEEDDSLRLDWTNPADVDFSHVRVVRSDTTFPTDSTDGTVVYEGPLETVLDSSILIGTLYYYSNFASDTSTNYSVAATTTGQIIDTTPPANVSSFNALEESDSIRLDWTNPADADFSYVRVVRSTSFFPLDPNDGTVVYEGGLETFLDSSVTAGVTYYYTNFAADANDNFASGAVDSESVTPPPDTTPPADVTGLAVTVEGGSLRLDWTNPSDTDFSYVRVVQSDTGYPTGPGDGVTIYASAGETVLDSSVSEDVWYYYSVYTYDTVGNFSAGVSDAGLVPGAGDPPPPPPPPAGGGDGGTVTPDTEPDPEATTTPATTTPPTIDPEPDPDPDPFVKLPIATTTEEDPVVIEQIKLVEQIDFSDFEIIQDGESQKFARGGKVSIDANQTFTISIDYSKTPEVLKTIGAVLRHPDDANKTFSLLLRVNKEKTAYEAIIAPLNKPGQYETTMYILNHDNQQLKKVHGSYIVYGEERKAELITETVSKVVGATGVGIGVTQVVVLTSNVASLSDIWLLFLRLITLLTGPFRRKKSEPWGVVYDSVTKRPLDPAYVMIQQKGQEKGEAVTDLDGRYGFLMQAGMYSISAAKTHYAFPSEKLRGKERDELYENLYFGGEVEIDDTKLVSYNIPLDPVEFDWNEFAKQRQQLYILHSRKERMKSIIFNTIFFFGFVFSSYTAWAAPSILNYSILGLYVVILLFQFLWRVTHKLTRVVNKETGIPLSFAIVKAYMAENKVQSKTVVTDQYGNFYMLLPPGKYFFTIEEKQSDGTYTLVHTSLPMNLKKGVITNDFLT